MTLKKTEATITTNPLQSSNTHTSTIQNTQKQNKTPKSAKQNKEQKLNLQHDNHSTLIHTNNFSLNSSNESLDQTSYSLSPTQYGANSISFLDNTSLGKKNLQKT